MLTTIGGVDIRTVCMAVCQCLLAHEDELTELDKAIGDGDHGINLARGCRALIENIETLENCHFDEAVSRIGQLTLNHVGGASGALYGSFLVKLGQSLAHYSPGDSVVSALTDGLNAVEQLGKSRAGDKTLVDVLAPVIELLQHGAPSYDRLADLANEYAELTTPMEAHKGRASFLGRRSVGHMDPGARSCALIVATVCRIWGGKPNG